MTFPVFRMPYRRSGWRKPPRDAAPQRIPSCIDPCFAVPLLYTPLGRELDALAIEGAILRKDARAKYLMPTLEETSERTFEGAPASEVRPP